MAIGMVMLSGYAEAADWVLITDPQILAIPIVDNMEVIHIRLKF